MVQPSSHRLVYRVISEVVRVANSPKAALVGSKLYSSVIPSWIWDAKCVGGRWTDVKHRCAVLYSAIESGHFSYRDLAIHVAHNCLFIEKISLFDFGLDLRVENISKTRRLYTAERLLRDDSFAKELILQVGLKSLEDIFAIGYEGESIAYKMVQHGKVSPLYVAMYDSNSQERVEHYKPTKEYKHFQHVVALLKTINQQTQEGPSNG
jgi:hypothetical protein